MTWLKLKRPLLVLIYDSMINDLRSQLKRMCKFLVGSCDKSLLDCIMGNRDGVDGRYHIEHDYSKIFTPKHHHIAEEYQKEVLAKLREVFPDLKIGNFTA